ncbi:MAG: hypothetical protein CMF23_08770 [Ignavibacteriae bacterium]|nr:hypothetical protein [Ignavibacteriota bacterium]|tara:strand:+ start:96 stop:284 length:189 start_codon:yes stop_codon:yes gene_type:complete
MASSYKINDWEKWSIDKGDYHRGFHSTSRFEKQIRRKRNIRNSIIIGSFLLVIGIITYFIFR